MSSFEGKVAVITGAGSGIGRALALNLSGKRAKLALSDVDTDGLAKTVRLAQALGAQVKSDRLDVAEREAVLAHADAVVAHFGTVHQVYNNAGIAYNGNVDKSEFKGTTVIFSAMRGVTLISMPQFDATKVWSLIVEERVCIGGAVPAILNFMRQVPEFAELDAPDFRYFITGGAPMPEALIKIYAAKNIEVVQGYALTESCGGGTLLLSEDALRKAGSAGRATMFTDVAVRGDDGVIREHGEGEVVIKSDILLKEYWNRPEATRDAFDNGWFRTGDIGEIDDEGYLYIKDRLKDMIISGGENVYPAEIESVIIGVPGVSEVAVIGLPDEKWGEIAAAIVVADQNEVSEQQIVEYCGTRLARYKLPKKVIFAEAIPRNPTGKILKTVLREQYSATVPK